MRLPIASARPTADSTFPSMSMSFEMNASTIDSSDGGSSILRRAPRRLMWSEKSAGGLARPEWMVSSQSRISYARSNGAPKTKSSTTMVVSIAGSPCGGGAASIGSMRCGWDIYSRVDVESDGGGVIAYCQRLARSVKRFIGKWALLLVNRGQG